MRYRWFFRWNTNLTLQGADGEQFQILLFIFSSFVFVFGDYVVAVLPKLLPGSVLVWLSAELMAFWVWNSLRFLRAYEYCLVWVMILMCLGLTGGDKLVFLPPDSILSFSFFMFPHHGTWENHPHPHWTLDSIDSISTPYKQHIDRAQTELRQSLDRV